MQGSEENPLVPGGKTPSTHIVISSATRQGSVWVTRPVWRKILNRECNIPFGSRVWQEGEGGGGSKMFAIFFPVQLTLPAEILSSPLSVCTDGG